MDDLLHQVLTVLRGMWHRRWIGLAVAWIAAIIGTTVALRIPERYEASARVYVDTQNLLRPLMEGLSIQPNLEQQVALMSRTLISRPNVEKLVRMADLDLATSSDFSGESIVDSLMKGLTLSGSVRDNLYVISYRDSNRERARKVVQSLLTIFVESSSGDKRQDTRAAVKFVDEQIKQYEENLKTAESRLKDFRLKYLGVAGQGGPDYFGRLSKLSDDIANARLELRAAEQSRDSYKRELAGEAPVLLPEAPEALAVPMAVPAIDARLASLKSDLDTLLRKYTEQHPDVVATKRLVDQLEQQRAEELQVLRKAAAAAGRNPESADRNPVFQRLRFSLAESEANVASLRAKLSSYEGQYAQLRSAARLVPQVEAEYAQLNRDYDIQKKTYETLLARRQSATFGEGVQDAGGTQFRVIDPPRVSPQPVPPTHIALIGIAFAAALAAGLFASFAASQIMPTFHDARALREVTKRPILGMVTMLPNETLGKLRRRNSLLFAGGVSGLLASFIAVFAVALLVTRGA
jgi:polysaccharide chain length determinant protein (PEP-CTERM system associated)